MHHVFTRKTKRPKLTLLSTPKYPVPVPVPLYVESLHDENKEVIREGKVKSIVYYDSDYGFQGNYKVTFMNEDKHSQYIT